MMVWSLRGMFLGLSLLPMLPLHVAAGPDECREAVDQLKSARSDISHAVRVYAICTSSSDGHDDCSSEFSTLQSAQTDFESAVSEYDSECQ